MEYHLVESLTAAQVDDLVVLYRNEPWSSQRQRCDVEKMLKTTDLVIGLVNQSDRLVAFTRVLTDFVYRATVYDVIVTPSDRGQGLGKTLLETVVQHPQLRSVEIITLFCLPEMIPFYEQWGFSINTSGMQLMFRNQF